MYNTIENGNPHDIFCKVTANDTNGSDGWSEKTRGTLGKIIGDDTNSWAWNRQLPPSKYYDK